MYCGYIFLFLRPRLCLHLFACVTAVTVQDLQCRFHHQWNRKTFAVAYVLALNSHHPRSRHQEGWHSHSQSSGRTQIHLFKIKEGMRVIARQKHALNIVHSKKVSAFTIKVSLWFKKDKSDQTSETQTPLK